MKKKLGFFSRLCALIARPEMNVFIPANYSEAEFARALRKTSLLRWAGYDVFLRFLPWASHVAPPPPASETGSLRSKLCGAFQRDTRLAIIGNRLVVLHDPSLSINAAQQGAEPRRVAGADFAAGGASVGAHAEPPECFIVSSSRWSIKRDRVAWFKAARQAGALGGGNELPDWMLVGVKLDSYCDDSYRILASVYDLDAQALDKSVAPAARSHGDLHAGAVDLPPQVDHAEHGADNGDGKSHSFHETEPTATPAATQPKTQP